MVQTVEIEKSKQITQIPRSLVYEEFDGHVFPYKGFRDVLNKTKNKESIMGSSSIQAMIVTIILYNLKSRLDKKRYAIVTNESGLHLSKKSNLSNDIAIFNKSEIKLTNKYFEVAPVSAVEVDIRADLTDEDSLSETDYIFKKSKKMIDFGTQQVIWVLTDSKKIIVVDHSPEWKIVDFNADVPILNGIVLNLQQLIEEEELEF
jgi:hypothetical protein